jgi:hypothetical protein
MAMTRADSTADHWGGWLVALLAGWKEVLRVAQTVVQMVVQLAENLAHGKAVQKVD